MLLSRGALSVLLCLAVGCGDDGPDAADSGVDAGRDGGRDQGVDGGPTDLGLDARDGATDGGPDDPEWVPLPDLPLGCRIERAVHPERLFTPRWTSCGEGCTYLEQDDVFELTPTSSGGPDRRTADAASFVFVGLGRRFEDPRTRPRINAFVGTDGTVAAAWRGPNPRDRPLCAVGNPDYADGWVGFSIWMRGDGGDEEYDAIFHGPLETMKDTERPVLLLGPDDLPGSGNILQQTYVSPEAVAFDVKPLGEVWLVKDGVRHRRAGSGSAVPGSPQRIALVGDHVLWNEWLTDIRIAHATTEDLADTYYAVPGTRVLFATDGDALAWVQGYGWDGATGFDRMELWTAAYRRDPADLEPRRIVESYTASTGGVVGAGLWVARAEEKVLELVSLDDGSRSHLAHDDPRIILLYRPVWVTATEIGIVGRWDTADTFFRLSREIAEPVE